MNEKKIPIKISAIQEEKGLKYRGEYRFEEANLTFQYQIQYADPDFLRHHYFETELLISHENERVPLDEDLDWSFKNMIGVVTRIDYNHRKDGTLHYTSFDESTDELVTTHYNEILCGVYPEISQKLEKLIEQYAE